ncbi:hypothetical protein [Paenibacillus sp. OAS669]|nr:hypothetical protein [Paenibacillus sp. OAS669]MBE1445548.1 hypothetical protein [Paenibacillus sp. OAS669]
MCKSLLELEKLRVWAQTYLQKLELRCHHMLIRELHASKRKRGHEW